ncbi:DDB1- and CUL4-associated factor 17 like protein [Argiope bruennichi]|uniref:DDB1- and CUL4-associated factor 17 like protein n=1 Tax=Argiope bruennichi TaxID=94029 RepID=A0A8T0F999_ARGBR|nr:DDB1- and CUL4-associated factor 17 like protein [Argiope bruennichi]
MLRLKKNKNIVCTLYDREINATSTPYKLSLNIMCQLIQSKQSFYESSWTKESSRPIVYDGGLIYFNNHKSCYNIYGYENKPSLTKLTNINGSERILDVISYAAPVFKQECNCEVCPCSCLSRSIIYITKDNWLIRRNPITGVILNKIYTKRLDRIFNFQYIDWNIYSKEVILTTKLNPEKEPSSNIDVVVNLAVFTSFPLEFRALLEIRRSVFGKACRHVNVSDQLLILGMNLDWVHIYSFEDVLANSIFTPYKIGDHYMKGIVGSYPFGLPLNCIPQAVPPLLFDVQSSQQIFHFGGYPYHCVYSSPHKHARYVLKQVEENVNHKNYFIDSNNTDDETDMILFHPDNSNRIVLREDGIVRCFQLVYFPNESKVQEIFSMGFSSSVMQSKTTTVSSYGRRITKPVNAYVLNEKSVLALDYDDELDLIGILGFYSTDPLLQGRNEGVFSGYAPESNNFLVLPLYI